MHSIGGLFRDFFVAKFAGFVCRLAKDDLRESVLVVFRSNPSGFESFCPQLFMELKTKFFNLAISFWRTFNLFF